MNYTIGHIEHIRVRVGFRVKSAGRIRVGVGLNVWARLGYGV